MRPRPRCGGSPASWPNWPRPQPATPGGFWATPSRRCAGPGPRPPALQLGGRDAAAGRRRGRLARAVNDLTRLVDATEQIVAQTRQRLAGQTPAGATRRVSLHDGDARPIAKGRLGQAGRVRPQGPGHRQRRRRSCSTTPSSSATPPTHRSWRPPSNGSSPAPGAHRARSPPTAATAKQQRRGRPARPRCPDRGDPPQGQTRPARRAQRTPASVPTNRQVANRQRRPDQHPQTRQYGWDRTRIDTTEGARIWAGHGVLAHNLVKISALTA